MSTDEPSFESLRDELDGIVARLEHGDVSLDEAIRLWRRGDELHRLCAALLEAAEGSVEELAAASDDNQDPGL